MNNLTHLTIVYKKVSKATAAWTEDHMGVVVTMDFQAGAADVQGALAAIGCPCTVYPDKPQASGRRPGPPRREESRGDRNRRWRDEWARATRR